MTKIIVASKFSEKFLFGFFARINCVIKFMKQTKRNHLSSHIYVGIPFLGSLRPRNSFEPGRIIVSNSGVRHVLGLRSNSQIRNPIVFRIIVDVINKAIGMFTVKMSPSNSMGHIVFTENSNLPMTMPMIARLYWFARKSCVPTFINSFKSKTNLSFFPNKFARFRAVIEKFSDMFRAKFHDPMYMYHTQDVNP